MQFPCGKKLRDKIGSMRKIQKSGLDLTGRLETPKIFEYVS